LADRAIAALTTVIRLEQGTVDSRSSTLDAVRRALEAAGVEFLSLREDGEGIRVHRPHARSDQ
jgi:predicted transcriptional regulator